MTSISNIWKQLISILSKLYNFHSLEVVDRVSETQLQVGGRANKSSPLWNHHNRNMGVQELSSREGAADTPLFSHISWSLIRNLHGQPPLSRRLSRNRLFPGDTVLSQQLGNERVAQTNWGITAYGIPNRNHKAEISSSASQAIFRFIVHWLG